VNIGRLSKKPKKRESDSMFQEPRDAAKHAELTQAEIAAAGKLVEQALHCRVLEDYSDEERGVLAILVGYHSYQQRARGKKGREGAKEKVERRRSFVNFFLRSIVEKKYRQKPRSLQTVMKIVDLLDGFGIEASEPQVRRDIQAILKVAPLPTAEA
jgi:hypothetical protein